jgi:hypothetical protein
MAVYPENKILEKCIYQIVENVEKDFYGFNSLYPTGSGLLGSLFPNDVVSSNIDMYNSQKDGYILWNAKEVLKEYDEYWEEMRLDPSLTLYITSWMNRKIYNV